MRLTQWAEENRYTPRFLAKAMAKQLNVEKFSTRTVEKWLYEKSMPEAKNVKALQEISGGQVTFDDLYEAAHGPTRYPSPHS